MLCSPVGRFIQAGEYTCLTFTFWLSHHIRCRAKSLQASADADNISSTAALLVQLLKAVRAGTHSVRCRIAARAAATLCVASVVDEAQGEAAFATLNSGA